MRLDSALYRLPVHFDAERLRWEALQFSEEAWRPHPQGFEASSGLPLVSAHGGSNDAVCGPMLPTDHLRHCPYLRQVLATFDTVIGRTRLMRLDAGAEVKPHCDLHYYWHDRVRVHVPIVSDPRVRVRCGGHETHMAPGEAWILDTWRIHSVVNFSAVQRIHLVFDTVGSTAFWNLVERSEVPSSGARGEAFAPRTVAYDPNADARFRTENHNLPIIMPPAKLEALITETLDDAAPEDGNTTHIEALACAVDSFKRCTRDWQAAWDVHGETMSGWPEFKLLQERLFAILSGLPGELRVRSNDQKLSRVLKSRVQAAINTGLARPASLLPPHGTSSQAPESRAPNQTRSKPTS